MFIPTNARPACDVPGCDQHMTVEVNDGLCNVCATHVECLVKACKDGLNIDQALFRVAATFD